jgi:hypothetical protein
MNHKIKRIPDFAYARSGFKNLTEIEIYLASRILVIA